MTPSTPVLTSPHPPLVAVPAARAMVDALLTGREAAQRHEDVAVLLSEVSPTRITATFGGFVENVHTRRS